MKLPIQAPGVRRDPWAWPASPGQVAGVRAQGQACECTVSSQGCNGTAQGCSSAGCVCNAMNECVCKGK